MQQELQNQERSRDSLAKELTEMINSNQELSHRLDRLETLLQEYEDLKTKYNALLQVLVAPAARSNVRFKLENIYNY